MEEKSLLDKLERVERAINIYRNEEDPELIEEINIDIPLEKLKSVVTPKDNDPLLYMGYILDAKQLAELNKELGGIINPDFSLYYYVLECNGIYNW
jgi:hypothetical protein